MSNLSNEVARRKAEQDWMEQEAARRGEAVRRHRINGGLVGGVIAVAGAIAIATPLVLSAMASGNDGQEDVPTAATVIQDDTAETVVDVVPIEETEMAESGDSEVPELEGDEVAPIEEEEVVEEEATVSSMSQARDVMLRRIGVINGGDGAPAQAAPNPEEPSLSPASETPVVLTSLGARMTNKENPNWIAYGIVSVIECDGGAHRDYYGMIIDASTGTPISAHPLIPNVLIISTTRSGDGRYSYDFVRTIDLYRQYGVQNPPEEAEVEALGGEGSTPQRASAEDGDELALRPQSVEDIHYAMRLGFIEDTQSIIDQLKKDNSAWRYGTWTTVASSSDGTASTRVNAENWRAEYKGPKEVLLDPESCATVQTTLEHKTSKTNTMEFRIVSSDSNIVSVGNSVKTGTNMFDTQLQAKGEGTANLTVYAYVYDSNGTKQCVKQQVIPVEVAAPVLGTQDASGPNVVVPVTTHDQIIMNQAIYASNKSVAMGRTLNIGATAKTSLTYQSSDVTVATVDARTGVVTPVKSGKATISITAAREDGYDAATKNITVTVTAGNQAISATNKSIAMGRTLNIGATAKTSLTYVSSNTKIVAVNKTTGAIKPVKPGKATITIKAAQTADWKAAEKKITVTVKKGANPMSVKPKKTSVDASLKTLKSKAVTLASNATVAKNQGTVTYSNSSTDKTAKKFVVNKNTGKVTVPKGTKKGNYKINVAVKAAGNTGYNPSTLKISYTIRVK